MLTIIIVFYKSDKLLLKKIIEKINSKFQIVIINNSYEDKLNFIKRENLIIINNKINTGNGAAINQGIKISKNNLCLYLDLDVNFKKDFIENFLKFAKKLKRFGILIPNINRKYKEKSLFENYNSEGCVMLFNKNVLKYINYFDERIFLYYEELDLFFRCKKNNIKIYTIPWLNVLHKRASSVSVKNKEFYKINNIRKWHEMWSMFFFYKKNYNYFIALQKTFPLFIKDILKIFLYIFLLDTRNIEIRLNRILGLFASIICAKSYKRIKS